MLFGVFNWVMLTQIILNPQISKDDYIVRSRAKQIILVKDNIVPLMLVQT